MQPPTLTQPGSLCERRTREKTIGSLRRTVELEPWCLQRFSKRSAASSDVEPEPDVVGCGAHDRLGVGSARRDPARCRQRGTWWRGMRLRMSDLERSLI